jgi:hypothetical protein
MQHCPGPHWSGNSLKLTCADILKLEEIAEKPSRACVDNDRVRAGNGLEPRRQIRRLANNAALVQTAGVDDVAHHD